MSKESEIQRFKDMHPLVWECKIDSLFKFFRYNPDHLSSLLRDKKLYHSLPETFNDPFECKPDFIMPTDRHHIKRIRDHLNKIQRREGVKAQVAEENTSSMMQNHSKLRRSIMDSTQKVKQQTRICCFSAQKENILLWSHYADSHQGVCIEFDATKIRISLFFKVYYSDSYPQADFPPAPDVRAFGVLLRKSRVWEYEEEFRSLFVTDAPQMQPNDGESLILNGDEIKNIYFGARINKEDKKQIFELVNNGPFRPEMWDAKLSETSYKLDFIPSSITSNPSA